MGIRDIISRLRGNKAIELGQRPGIDEKVIPVRMGEGRGFINLDDLQWLNQDKILYWESSSAHRRDPRFFIELK